MRSNKQPAALPVLALTAWLAMPAHAADGEFAVGQDFLSAEPTRSRNLPGTDLHHIKHLPAKSLKELMAAARDQLPLDRKAKLAPLVLNPNKPMVYVSGPNTKDQLTAVVLHDDMKAREREEEEILREAEEALKMDLPAEPEPRPLPMKASAPLVAKLPPMLGPVATKPRGAVLNLVDVGHELRITPKTLQMSMLDDGITVVEKNFRGSPQIFLRNSKIVRWEAKRKRLDARGTGRTELYITYRDQLYIVPIEVRGRAHRDPLLADDGPGSFQKLTSVMPLLEQPYASYGEAPVAETPAPQKNPAPAATAHSGEFRSAGGSHKERVQQQLTRFFYPDASPDYRVLDIQVMDERSLPETKEDTFPVSDVTVRVVGTRLIAGTNASGLAKFGEIPDGSRFFVEIQDEKNGQVVPTVTEVAMQRNGDQVIQVRAMRFSQYSRYLEILDTAQDTSKSSVCGRVMVGNVPQPNYTVSLKSFIPKVSKLVYINSMGAPDTSLGATTSTGRFCFFNVPAGLAELTLETRSGGTDYSTSLSMPLFAGAHAEEDLPLDGAKSGHIVLAATPNATEQIYEERAAIEQPLQPVDSVNMITVGTNEPMIKANDAVLGYQGGMSQRGGTTLFKGRFYSMVETAEFENTLYAFDRDERLRDSLPVAPLLQRGYIQDVFHELAMQDNQPSIAYDQNLGAVVVLHRVEPGMGAAQVSLVNAHGQVLNDGWSFGNAELGMSRTVFFNLNPGVYSVILEAQQGGILGLDTIAVDYESVSVVQAGSSAHYSLKKPE